MTRPEIRELECFVAVADHLNFSRAAGSLNLSQPPLTRHIQALEEKLGARLFNRNTHAVALTGAGNLFLEDARVILQQLDRASETIRRSSQGEIERLRLAFVGALLDEKLIRLIRRFRDERPGCQVEVTDLSPGAQLTALQAGTLDGGFIGARPSRDIKGLVFAVWKAEPLLLAVPEGHPLASMRDLSWNKLRHLGWIMVSRHAAPAFRNQFSQLEKKHGLAARIVQESDRVPAVLTMVAAGGGVTMIPQAVEHLITKGIVVRKLPAPCPQLQHTFAWREKSVPPVLEKFLSLLRREPHLTCRPRGPR